MPGAEAHRKTEQPLTGRTVVITRARAQTEEFASELERYGARVISCPTIEIVPPESYAPLDEAIDNLYGYDWVIFTSVNGVEHFLTRLKERNDATHKNHELDRLHVCAIGEATARRLTDAQVHVDVVPERFQAEGVFEALQNYLGGAEGFKALNILIPRAAAARDYLPSTLAEAGARVDVIPAYRTVTPDTSELGRVGALLRGGAVDCLTFTSSSTVRNFAQLFDTTDLSQLLDGTAVACIGNITAETARSYGLRTDIQPQQYTIPALARAIADHFAEND